MEKMDKYVLDENFLKSVKANARLARVHAGMSTPDISLAMIQTQQLNDLNNAIVENNSKLDKVVELLEKIAESKSSTKTATETTKTVETVQPKATAK